jgi:putative NIF3 family GTP cyclohydrolase 1 type 2
VQESSLQRSLLRCAASGISIFSPHTSLDSVKLGVNDWLVSAFEDIEKSTPIEPKVDEEAGTGIGRLVVLKSSLSLPSLYPIIKRHLGVPYSRFYSLICSLFPHDLSKYRLQSHIRRRYQRSPVIAVLNL